MAAHPFFIVAFVAIVTIVIAFKPLAIKKKEHDFSKLIEVGVSYDTADLAGEDVQSQTLGIKKYLIRTEYMDYCTIDDRKKPGQTTETKTVIHDSSTDKGSKSGGKGALKLANMGPLDGLNINANMEKTVDNTVKTVTIERTMTVSKGLVTLKQECLSDPRVYSPAFKATLRQLGGDKELPEYFFETQRVLWEPYWTWMDNWGDEVITAVEVGYSMNVKIEFTQALKVNQLNVGAHADLKVTWNTTAKPEESSKPAGEGKVEMEADVDIDKRDNSDKSDLKIDITIMGGGHAETGRLVAQAHKFYGDVQRAKKIAAGQERKEAAKAAGKKPEEGEDDEDTEDEASLDMTKYMNEWVRSCSDPGDDTSRLIRMESIGWEKLLAANGIASSPYIRINMERAARIRTLLWGRTGCPLGCWDTRNLQCDDTNDHDSLLGKERYIKAANGMYAHVNVETNEIDLVQHIQEATKFIFMKEKSRFNGRIEYSLSFTDDNNDPAFLYSMDRKGKFGTSRAPGGIKGGFGFMITSKGAISLAPRHPREAGTDVTFMELSVFMQQQGTKLVFRTLDLEPDHDDDRDLSYFFIFEDPFFISLWDGARGTTRYSGGRRNNKWNGLGIVHWGKGNSYDGNWLDDQWHGPGVLTIPSMNARFEGIFKGAKQHGPGVLIIGPALIPFGEHSGRVGTKTTLGTWVHGKLYSPTSQVAWQPLTED